MAAVAAWSISRPSTSRVAERIILAIEAPEFTARIRIGSHNFLKFWTDW